MGFKRALQNTPAAGISETRKNDKDVHPTGELTSDLGRVRLPNNAAEQIGNYKTKVAGIYRQHDRNSQNEDGDQDPNKPKNQRYMTRFHGKQPTQIGTRHRR